MSFLQLMQERYTAKHYDASKRISQEDLTKILECARLAPSSVNLQPWRLFIGQGEAKAKLMPCLAEFNQMRCGNADTLIAICSFKELNEEIFAQVLNKEQADKRITNDELKAQQDKSRHHFANLHAQDQASMLAWTQAQAYIAMTTILYAAQSLGIDSTAIEGFDQQKANEILNLSSSNLSVVALVALGYRSKDDKNVISIRPKSRLKSEDLMTFL